MQRYFNMILNMKNVHVERISFIDYVNNIVYPSFPIGKKLCFHNTATFETFGFGRYNGHFFDVIVRLEDSNAMNYRIFYDIDIEENISS